MALQLYFGDTAIGTHLLKAVPMTQAATPAVVAVGLWQDVAAVISVGANRVNRLRVEVALMAASAVDLAEALAAIQALAGGVDDLEIREGVTVMVSGTSWICDQVEDPQVPDGFGGRFCDRLAITFSGSAALTFP